MTIDNIRDLVITGSYMIGENGMKEPAYGWKDYANKLEEILVKNNGSLPNHNAKIAKNSDEAWEMQETYKNKPHGWVQWKGTNVCMDIHCTCGHHSHIDAKFAYFVKCPKCGTVFMCNGHIELIELKEEPENCVITPELEEY